MMNPGSMRNSQPNEEAKNEAVLYVDGRNWDLSNLCPRRTAPKAPPEPKHKPATRGPVRKFVPESSLYPTVEDLERSVSNMETASVAFHRAPRRSSSVKLSNSQTLVEADTSEGIRPGAFHTSSPPVTSKKPPLPSWVDQNTEVERKIDAAGHHDSMKKQAFPSYPPSTIELPSEALYQKPPSATYAVSSTQERPVFPREASCSSAAFSTSSTQSQPVPQRTSSSRTNYSTNSAYMDRAQVEISPGEYMPLRGSAETMSAIQSGHVTTVSCLACHTRLKCVADADLVICPDCRILSPLPEGKVYEDEYRASGSTADAPWNEGFRVGGVGLGLKVDYEYS